MRGPKTETDGATEELDGRMQRSVRSRERILDALTELISEGDLQPTVERVADRAGYGLRTVYRHFEDVEGLYRELQGRIVQIVQGSEDLAVPEGTLEERLRASVRRRTRIYERATPFLRSGASLRWRSLFLTQAHAKMVRELREDLQRSLPELKKLPSHRRESAELLTSFEAWDRLRTEQRLGRERAQAVVEETLRDLLVPKRTPR